jgi:hypothetical protein
VFTPKAVGISPQFSGVNHPFVWISFSSVGRHKRVAV